MEHESSALVRILANLLITGPGITWVACALANGVCRDGVTVLYHRLSRLLAELGYDYGDGRYLNLMKKLTRTDVLVLDDRRLNTHADAILDRLVHNAYRIVLKGKSMRKITAKGGGTLTAQS